MWRAVLAAVLIVCAVIVARQFSNAPPDPNGNAAVANGNEEAEICRGKGSFTYKIDGERYALPFEVIDDQAVVERDIVLGQAADVLNGGANYVPPDYIRGEPKRWENNLVPYVIDASVTASHRALIEQAITAWQGATKVRFGQLSGARDWKREDYVKFSDQKIQCSSNSLGIKQKLTGSVNEEENVNVVEVAGCGQNWGNVAHEIGHVLGLGHEHSRGHRDDYITILWSNIDRPKQFCRVIWDQPTLANTSYDYDSITHYAPTQGAGRSQGCKKVTYDGKEEDCLAFLPNQKKLEQQRQAVESDIEPGQRDHLSEGDIARVNMLYPASSPATSSAQPCVRSERTTIKTEPCYPHIQKTIIELRPVRPQCCQDRMGCPPAACPAVRVSRPRPDGWCRSGWCRTWPARRCDGWFEDRWQDPPFDDRDDGRW
jgi:hypothetical protein